MPSLEKPPVVTTTVKWRWPSVHPDGRKFVLIAAALAFVFTFFVWDELGFALIALTVWVAAFFRDPIRSVPQGEGLVIAPADGLITLIQAVRPPPELAGPDGLGDAPMVRVSIFMSVFDVHINRAPIAGVITRVVYIAGKFLNADLDKASEDNERQHFLVEGSDGMRVGFTQIAGLIRFGSRVDVYLPAGTLPRVALGQRTIAGETVIAKLGESEAGFGVPQ